VELFAADEAKTDNKYGANDADFKEKVTFLPVAFDYFFRFSRV